MNRKYFPWRLYRHFLWVLGCLIGGLSLLTAGLLVAYVHFLSGLESGTEAFTKLQAELLWLSPLLFFLLGTGAAFFLAWRLSLPVQRLILKAMSLTSKKQAKELSDEVAQDVFLSTTDEYFDLEQAMDRISRKLLKRRTQLAHEREQAQAIMSFMTDGVVSIDREEKLIFFNSYFGAQFMDPAQVKNADEKTRVHFSDVFRDPALSEGLRKALDQALVSQFQRKLATKLDPTGRHFSITVTPLREEKGGGPVYGALLIFHDITDLKTTELMKSEFVENASHELRTPLTNLKGYVSAAIEDLEKGQVGEVPHFLGVISKNVQRLSDLVNDLLTLSSLEHKTALKMEEVDPAVVTNSIMEQFNRTGNDRGIVFKAFYDCPRFRADLGLVERVLVNLVGNAVKYSHEGGVIEIRWSEDKPNRGVLLSVKDYGPGIGEEHLGRLFERFYRVDKGRSRDVGGTGLGLAIVKHAMQNLGGTVGVRSTIGQGSEFICFFPRGVLGSERSRGANPPMNLSSDF